MSAAGRRALLLATGAAALAGLSAQAREPELGPGLLDHYLVRAFQAGSFRERPALNHIGVRVRPAARGHRVTAVLDGLPAHAAGLRRGDVVLSADGRPFHPVDSFNPGPAPRARPEPVELELDRGGTRLRVAVAPVFGNLFDSYRTATLNSARQFSVGNKVVGYARLWALSRGGADLVAYRRILASLARCDGLVLDLRDGHGFLGPEHLDLFHGGRAAGARVSGAGGRLADLSGPRAALVGEEERWRKPVAVLVNGGTRGGPELLARLLGGLERVTVLGEPSAGRIGGYRETADGALRYRPAAGVLVDGVPFEGTGTAPDAIVPFPLSRGGRGDPQFDAALAALLGVI